VAEEQDGRANVLINPGYFGTYAMIDFCRGYAYFVLSKALQSEQKANIHQQLKEVVDEHFPSQCH
jgi:hypothetical protein